MFRLYSYALNQSRYDYAIYSWVIQISFVYIYRSNKDVDAE